ncbi:aminomethyl transferase family protein [Sinisalibacter aestuarii]|uniref:Glycine cleavage system protein T n=1 Tax=Sinisalibacter aestuarii TaxID=2949426 RepID=A0ABQ5LNQ7_9RHOB|nr:aminomethyl transferase family protein [Sinisalibacter aestuarii]GKY86637.1 glycine cleavage system protein T [Sinisalibacter aestuarii]
MKSLQDRLDARGNPARMMYESQMGRYAFPIASEFSHWIEEMRAWRESAALMDQSFHMTDLYVKGPDAIKLLSDLSVNSFAGFGKNKAKQLVCVSHEGYVIGDAIVFGLEDDEVNVVGRPVLPNWVQFFAETGGYDVTVTRDQRSLDDPDKPRLTYRYEVQGPKALDILNKVNEGGPLTTKFFNMGEITIAGCKARTLSHGMGGQQGLEIWGPVADGPKVKAALIEAGAEYGLRLVGARAYAAAAAESGWVPSPLPAIYTGEQMKPYRDWLPANSFEALSSLGGSYVSDNVEDYYLTPWDLDYGRVVRFDHDFIGRDALEKMAGGPHRKKVTLVWNAADVAEIYGGLLDHDGLAPKYMEMPAAHYAAHPYDRVSVDGRFVGVSITPVYSPNERAWISLAILDPEVAEIGTEVTVTWGEPDGGSSKPTVERHRQVEVRAIVQPWPIHSASRESYRSQT